MNKLATMALAALWLATGCQLPRETIQEGETMAKPTAVTGNIYDNPLMKQGWYPRTEAELRHVVAGSLRLAAPVAGGTVHALIAPHAGAGYCATQAAAAYKAVEGRRYDRVIVVAFSHRVAFPGYSVLAADGYRTPLGVSPIDVAAVAALRQAPGGSFVARAHDPENSAATQVPWIQGALGLNVTVVELLLGQPDEAGLDALARTLDPYAADGKTLFVFSTDMSHFHDGNAAERMDRETIRRLEAGEYAALEEKFESRELECCGAGPLAVAGRLARLANWPAPRILAYGHSGQVVGDYERVVGYMGGVIADGAAFPPPPRGPITAAGGQELLQLARRAVETFVRSGDTIAPPADLFLPHQLGAFVTLKEHGELRGCIGNMAAAEELPRTIIAMAIAAAAHDPRFAPVTAAELGALEYEISVLTPFARIHDPKTEVRVGRDGLLLRLGGRSGVFLPQVPVEQGWDLAAYLQNLCRKAGLPASALTDPRAEFSTFTAQVLGEAD